MLLLIILIHLFFVVLICLIYNQTTNHKVKNSYIFYLGLIGGFVFIPIIKNIMCPKKYYFSLEEATTAANKINLRNSKNKKKKQRPLRAYKCETCNNFHLTSMSKGYYKLLNDNVYRDKRNTLRILKVYNEYYKNQ